MDGEGSHQDYKLEYNPTDPKAKLDLVKNLVAFANAGGGRIVFGRDESVVSGLSREALDMLDSARLADSVAKYIAPAQVNISHHHEVVDGKSLCVVTVHPAQYPLVMNQDGHWKGMDTRNSRSLFTTGDIWTRHSSKTERATYEDIRAWIESARQAERDLMLRRLDSIINIPEGAEIQIVTKAEMPADTPKRLLQNAIDRRAANSDHLLNAHELLYMFLNRGTYQLTSPELAILIASALRRSPTLYWWLKVSAATPDMIVAEIYKCIAAKDRDKSDAAHNLVELSALYADDLHWQEIIELMARSRYKHFRAAVQPVPDRAFTRNSVIDKVSAATLQGKRLVALPLDHLELAASELAQKLMTGAGNALSRSLGTLTRVIWYKSLDSQPKQ